jgi:hypothetical protein
MSGRHYGHDHGFGCATSAQGGGVPEYLSSGDVAEVAALVEVCFAAAALHGVGQDELLAIARAKRAQRGGFDGRLVWMGNLPGAHERLQGRQRDGGAGANGLAGPGGLGDHLAGDATREALEESQPGA